MNKNKTIFELIDEVRRQSGEPELAGHDIMALECFDPDVTHMIVFDVLSHSSPVGNKGERMRLSIRGIKRHWRAKIVRKSKSLDTPK